MSLSSLKIIKHTKWIKYNTSHHQFKYYEHQSRHVCGLTGRHHQCSDITGILIDWNIKLSLTTCWRPDLAVFMAAQKHTVYFSFGLCTAVTSIEREKRGGGASTASAPLRALRRFSQMCSSLWYDSCHKTGGASYVTPDLFIYSCVAFLPRDAGMKPAVD